MVQVVFLFYFFFIFIYFFSGYHMKIQKSLDWHAIPLTKKLSIKDRH